MSSNIIKIKAGSGTPTTSDIQDRELAFDRSADKLYINDAGTIVDLNTTGDIEGVTAGTGLSGGGTSGTVNLDIDLTEVGFGGGANRLITDDGDGTVSTEANLTFDGTNLDLPDSKKVRFGTDNDFEFYHDDTNAVINNTKGDLQIYNNADDKNIVLLSDDGSGGTTPYLTLDGSAGFTKANKQIKFLDNVKGIFGDSSDLEIYHDGTNDIINTKGNAFKLLDSGQERFTINSAGNIQFNNAQTDANTRFGTTGSLYTLWVDGGTDRVGIGTNSPSYKLDVSGTGRFTGLITASGGIFTDGSSLGYTSDGYSRASSGNASVPGFSFASDTNTGMYKVGADKLGFTSGGTLAMMVDSNQNVGIGTTAPLEELDIAGSLKVRGDSSVATEVLELGQFVSPNVNTPQYTFNTYDAAGGLPSMGDHLEIRSVRWGQSISFSRNGQGGAVPTALFYNASSSGYMELYKALNPTTDATYQPNVKLNVNGDSFFRGGSVTIGDVSPLTAGGTPRLSLQGAGLNIGANANDLSYIRRIDTGDYQWQTWNGSNDGQIHLQPYGGNVGIGTTTPNHLLEIEGQTNDTEVVQISNNAGGSGSVTGITHLGITHFPGNTYSSTRITAIENGTASYTGHLAFSTRSANTDSAPAERMRIASSGNVGIGTISPTARLHISENGGSTDDAFVVNPTNGGNRTMTIDGEKINVTYSNSGGAGPALVLQDNGGNVGIGTVSPADLLHIADTVSSNALVTMRTQNSFGYAEFGTQSNYARLLSNGTLLYAGQSSQHFHYIGGSTAMTLNGTGLGIGTSPASKLDLGGSTSGQRLTFSNTGVNTTNGARTQAEIGYKTGSYGGAAVIKILTENQYDDSMALAFHTGTSAAETMRIDSSQNVGIGTSSPGNKLEVRGDIAVAISDTQDIIKLSDAGNDGSIEIYTGEATPTLRTKIVSYGDTYFNAASTGRVGIGTASPAEKLHVVGDVRIDTDLYIQPTNKFYLDGGLDTYIKESSANVMEFYCADSRRMQLTTTYLQVPDGAYLAAGNDNDIFIRHDGNGHLQSNTGQMYINNVAATNIIMSVGNDEKVRIENDGDLHVKADVVAYSSVPSDIRLKKNFTKIDNGLDVISKLDGQTFNWKKDEGRLSAGFKAQEVEKVLPHLVDERKLPLHSDDEKDYKVLRYEEIIPYLVEAIKEQQEQINKLEEKLNG